MAAKTAYDFRTVAGYETNVPPSAEFLQKASEVFGVEISELLVEIPEMKDHPKPATGLYSHLSAETLSKILMELSARLNHAPEPERKHIVGNIREVLDELETKLLTGDQLLMKRAEQSTREKPSVVYPHGRQDVSSKKSLEEEIGDAILEGDEKPPPKHGSK